MSFSAQTAAFGGRQDGCRQLDSAQAMDMIRMENAVVVDVREPHEYAAGHIPDSHHIPLRQIGFHLGRLKEHGDRSIILSCRTGSRSEMVCRFLRDQGFSNIYNLAGGVMGWRLAELPLAM